VKVDVDLLRETATEVVRAVDETAEIEVERGRPADTMLDLAAGVDLIVIGPRPLGTGRTAFDSAAQVKR
jgi:hypothetical protein